MALKGGALTWKFGKELEEGDMVKLLDGRTAKIQGHLEGSLYYGVWVPYDQALLEVHINDIVDLIK